MPATKLPSTKVTAATIAAAVATIAFILLARLSPKTFTAEDLASLQGAATTL
jgi:hypothetical protein